MLSSKTHLVCPSDTSDDFALHHNLLPFRKWLNITHLNTYIQGQLSLLPFADAKHVIASLKMIGMSFRHILISSKIPPPVSTFQLTRFMSIMVPTGLTTIRPTLTYFVSKHHKCHTQCRIDGIFDKRSSIIVLFKPPFLF